jgi:hypothetical protein
MIQPGADAIVPDDPPPIEPPQKFIELNTENRLIDPLRKAAQLKDAEKILTRAGVAYYRSLRGGVGRPGDEDLGNALADLAVTGRITYDDLQARPVSDAALIPKITDALIADGEAQPIPASVIDAARLALNRAYGVAWALRGPASQRLSLRGNFGWIAVSGEDDTAHRPVNVPAMPFGQYEIPVTAAANAAGSPAVTARTRFYIASVEDPAPVAILPAARALPPDPIPHVPDEHEVILFLHGDCSSAEEASAVIPQLHMAGLAQGKKYSIVSLDLPNNGYAETFPHKSVAPLSGTSWPGGLDSHVPLMTPILDFTENYVVAFVDALDQITPIKDRIAGVIGGSLGGNLGLRLGRRDFTGQKDWRKAIVSWSAASVWAPTVNDLLKSTAPGRCMKAADDPETPLSRADHFNNVYDKKLDDLLLPWTQPDTWYWKDWPFREDHIKASRRGRREIYNTNFRQWHWRLSAEQVIFSHVDRVDREVNNSPYRYELNTVLQLLCAAQDDNYRGANIFDATRTLANLMVTTPGRSMFLANTGHSMHVERPQFLASKIVDFFITAGMDPLFQVTCVRKEHGRITRLGGSNLTTGESFDLSEPECILSISKGNEFFVLGGDGSKAAVYVVAGDSSIYLSTSRDSSRADNLLSLPEC